MLEPFILNLTKEQEHQMQIGNARIKYFQENHSTVGLDQYLEELGLNEEAEENKLGTTSGIDKPTPKPKYHAVVRAKESVSGLEPISAKELLETDYEEQIFILENILPIGLSILAGRPKIGKSFMALQMAIAIGTGGEFLGEIAEEGSVAYIAFEDNDGRLARRLKKAANIDLPPEIYFYPYDLARQEFDNLNTDGIQKLKRLTEVNDLVIIDTLSECIHVDYNDNNAITKALMPIQELALETETAILLIDHLRKSNGRNPYGLSEVRGGTGKIAVADCIWGLHEEAKNTFLQITGRDVEERKLQIAFDKKTYSWKLSDEKPIENLSQLKSQIIEFLKQNGDSTNLEIAKMLEKDKSNVHKVLSSLRTDKVIDRKRVANTDQYFIYQEQK